MKKLYFLAFIFSLFLSLETSAQVIDTLKEVRILERRILTSPVSYSTISYDSLVLSQYQFSEISKLMSEQSGLYIKSIGPNGLSTLSVRGLSVSHTKIYWNGVSITPPTLGLSDMSLIPSFFFEKVNVNIGGASLIDGSGALGGSINLINKNVAQDGQHIMFGVKYNPTLNSKDKSFMHQWKKRKFSVQTKLYHQIAANNFYYTERTFRGYDLKRRENADLLRYGISQNYYLNINSKQELSFNTIYLFNDKNIPAPIYSANNGQFQQDEIFRNNLGWKFNSRKFFHRIGIAYLNENSHYEDPVSFIEADFKIKTISCYYHFGYNFSPHISFGMKLNNDNHQVKSTGFTEIINQSRWTLLSTVSYEKDPDWGAVFSMRNEYVDNTSHDLSPSIGAFALPIKNKKYKLKANLSKNIRVPALNDLYWENGGNVNLLDEKSLSGELGLDYENRNLKLNLTYFNSVTDNWIQWMPQSNNIWQPMNIKRVNSEGVEFGAKYLSNVKDKLKKELSINYRHGRTYNAEVNDGGDHLNNELIYTPKDQLSINVNLGMKTWGIKYSQKITSRTYTDASNEIYLPYYAPANLSLFYSPINKAVERLIFEVMINNLFDEEYQVVANQPIPKRNIALMMRLYF